MVANDRKIIGIFRKNFEKNFGKILGKFKPNQEPNQEKFIKKLKNPKIISGNLEIFIIFKTKNRENLLKSEILKKNQDILEEIQKNKER